MSRYPGMQVCDRKIRGGTIRTGIKVFLFLMIVVAGCLVAVAVYGGNQQVQSSVNAAVFDTLDIQDRISDAVADHKAEIAAKLGMSDEEVDNLISQADIDDWTPTALPSDAVATGTRDVSYGGDSATVTTYEDPSYVTITYSGATVTFSVPQSAQSLVAQIQ